MLASSQILQPVGALLGAGDAALRGRMPYAQLVTAGMIDLR